MNGLVAKIDNADDFACHLAIGMVNGNVLYGITEATDEWFSLLTCTIEDKVYSSTSELNKYIDVLNLLKETASQKKMTMFEKIIDGDWNQTYSGGAFSNIVSELLGILRFE